MPQAVATGAIRRCEGRKMMGVQLRRMIKVGGVAISLCLVAACGPKSTPAPPPPPPAPPPPPVVVIPPRPQPPLGAGAGLLVPVVGADGVRQTINARLTPGQTVWNLRSAYNVAALNCLKPEHAEILVGYKTFLKTHKKGLTAANKVVDSDFRRKFGGAFIRPREAYMTQVYNYFAYPATLGNFCDAALVMARESKAIKPAELNAFSTRNLTMLDGVFETFFRTYEQYQLQLASWDAKYGPRTGMTAVTAAPSTK